MVSHFPGVAGTTSSRAALLGGACLVTAAAAAAAAALWPLVRTATGSSSRENQTIASPRRKVLDSLSEEQITSLPYPPDILPGGRDVATPYGSIRVFEWGSEDGDKMLFLHGISTPTISQGDLAHEMVAKGYRVMLFDLFGRGYSDAPADVPYDARLYTTQILLVLASSSLAWSCFHLVGYSLGGGLAVSFARYFPRRLKSLTLVAGGGLIRRYHVGWQSWFLYNSGLLPESLVRRLVKRRIRPSAEPPKAAGGADLVAAESHSQGGQHRGTGGNSDANGGPGFDSASISRRRPHVSVSSVIAWQVDHHQGFVTAFLSTIRNAPIYEAYEDWTALGPILAERRQVDTGIKPSGLSNGQVLLVLGKTDPVVVPSETIEDAERILGKEGVHSVVLEAGHELPISLSQEVGNSIDTFVRRQIP